MSDAGTGGIVGVLLAGGQARRMGGGDKCLRELGGITILERIIETVRPQVDALVLNANGDPQRFSAFGLPVADDIVPGFAGPLAGILTGMRWAAGHAPAAALIATFPTDAPFLPTDMVARLCRAREESGAPIARAVSSGRYHPVAAVWPVALADDLERALTVEDLRKIDVWSGRYGVVEVEWASSPVDPFFNANRPEDLAAAEEMLAAL